MTPIRVLLADDHTLVRAGIRALLLNLAGVEVVGEAGDGISLKTVEAHRAQIMDRLDVHEIAGLVRFAIRVGLVTPEE